MILKENTASSSTNARLQINPAVSTGTDEQLQISRFGAADADVRTCSIFADHAPVFAGKTPDFDQ